MLVIDDMAIELTRRCNMACPHCLRGEPQDVDLSLDDLDRAIRGLKVDQINNVTLTGGEPSLVPSLVLGVLETLKTCGVEVGSFYIATNGKFITEDFVVACLRWYAYCDNNECSQVHLSNDRYHEPLPEGTTDLLKGLTFFTHRHDDEGSEAMWERYLHKMGRQKTGRVHDPGELRVESWGDDIHVYDATVQITSLGKAVVGCDWSFEIEDKMEPLTLEKIQEAANAHGADQ